MRKPLLAGLAVLLVLVGILLTLLLPRPSRVTFANYERIKVGMTRAEVEQLLGAPPGDYRTWPTKEAPHGLADVEGFESVGCHLLIVDEECQEWLGDEGKIWLGLNGDGRVLCKALTKAEPVGGLLKTLRWRLKRRWEKLWGRAGP